MNPWTALLIGILLGWLIEYVIDWLFWRRKSENEKDVEELKLLLQVTQDQVVDLEAQLAAAQADYSDLEVETAAKVVEVEEKAAATVEANKPEYDSDEFKGSLQGRLAGLGIGAAAVGAAVTSGDETGIEKEEEPSAAEAAEVDHLDSTDVASGSNLLNDAPGTEESELLDNEVAAIEDGTEELIEKDDADQLEGPPPVADLDQDEGVPDVMQEPSEGDAGSETQVEDIEPPAGESGYPSEGGQAS